MAGIRNARVLPVPVLALQTRSTPERKTGREAACTFVQFWYCIFSKALSKTQAKVWEYILRRGNLIINSTQYTGIYSLPLGLTSLLAMNRSLRTILNMSSNNLQRRTEVFQTREQAARTIENYHTFLSQWSVASCRIARQSYTACLCLLNLLTGPGDLHAQPLAYPPADDPL